MRTILILGDFYFGIRIEICQICQIFSLPTFRAIQYLRLSRIKYMYYDQSYMKIHVLTPGLEGPDDKTSVPNSGLPHTCTNPS